MSIRAERPRRVVPLVPGIAALAGVLLLLFRDAAPQWFWARSHDDFAAFSLAMIALSYLAFQIARRATIGEMARAILLASAFLFWAANQLWPNIPQAALFNDIAIGLFVLDVFLAMAGRRTESP